MTLYVRADVDFLLFQPVAKMHSVSELVGDTYL